MTTTTRTLLPAATAALTQKQRADILAYIKELTNAGNHLAASTLYQQYFGLI